MSCRNDVPHALVFSPTEVEPAPVLRCAFEFRGCKSLRLGTRETGLPQNLRAATPRMRLVILISPVSGHLRFRSQRWLSGRW